MAKTCIFIEALTFDMSIGDEPEEKAKPQPVSIDLKVYADFSKVNHSDLLSDTVDYIAIVQTIQAIAARKHYDMLEHFSYSLIDGLFQTYPLITKVALHVHKPEMHKCQAKKIGVAYTYDRSDWQKSVAMKIA